MLIPGLLVDPAMQPMKLEKHLGSIWLPETVPSAFQIFMKFHKILEKSPTEAIVAYFGALRDPMYRAPNFDPFWVPK